MTMLGTTPECDAHLAQADCNADTVNHCIWEAFGGSSSCLFDNPQIYPELAGTSCVCIVFRNNPMAADGLSDYGFVSSTEGCRAYRALYPADVQCVTDTAWHTLP